MSLLESLKLPLNTPAIDFNLKGIDDQMHDLSKYSAAKVLVIVFTCNHCPYAQAVWPRLIELQKKYATTPQALSQSVQFLALNPNNNPAYPDDSFAKMKEFAKEWGINFPYLQDTTQQTARAYKAQCTPDIYVFNSERKLAYHGRVDDNWKEPEKATKHELDDAIVAILKGEKPSGFQHPCMGCSIKYLE